MAWGPRAIERYERAVELDPSFAEAYAALAQAHLDLAENALDLRYLGEFPKARDAAQRALEIDDRLGAAHAALGSVRLFHEWDFAAAGHLYERAVHLGPSDPEALQGYALFLLSVDERTEDALAVYDRLLHVAPLDIFFRTDRFRYFFFTRQYQRAIEEVERLRELDPDFVDLQVAVAYSIQGQIEEAREAQIAFFERCGGPCEWMQETSQRGWLEGGWEGVWRAMLEVATGIEGFSPVTIAGVFASIGETEEAFTWLERGYRERDPLMIFLKVHPGWDPLRSDPRFDDLLRRIGFPEK
jgi:tetratricopeptide (TPR) repeat protein